MLTRITGLKVFDKVAGKDGGAVPSAAEVSGAGGVEDTAPVAPVRTSGPFTRADAARRNAEEAARKAKPTRVVSSERAEVTVELPSKRARADDDEEDDEDPDYKDVESSGDDDA